MPTDYYTYDQARKHKRHHQGVWAQAIWVDDAGEMELAVIHWMGGGYKVVGRYKSDQGPEARDHVERCSASGYCPTTPADKDGFLKVAYL